MCCFLATERQKEQETSMKTSEYGGLLTQLETCGFTELLVVLCLTKKLHYTNLFVLHSYSSNCFVERATKRSPGAGPSYPPPLGSIFLR